MGEVSGLGGNNNFIKDDLKVNKTQEKVQAQPTEEKEAVIKQSKDGVNVAKLNQSKFDPANSNVNLGELLEKSKDKEIGPIGGGINGGIKFPKNTTLAYGEEGGISPGKIIKIEDIFAKQQPGEMVEEIRNSKGGSRDDALLGFQDKLDKMGNKELKVMRDYLVTSMADPQNKDDELLGSLLNKVNHELDSREKASIHATPININYGNIPIHQPHIVNFDLDTVHAVTKSMGEGAELFNNSNMIKKEPYHITKEALDSVINSNDIEKKKD